MGRGVKEWPTNDVLQRKYQDSWVVFEPPEGQLYQGWVDGCEMGGSGPIFFLSNIGEVKHLPVYYPIESGYYTLSKGNVLLLERKFTPHKNYHVGVGNNGWSLWECNTGDGGNSPKHITKDSRIDFLNPIDRSRFLTRGLGVVNRKYLITADQVFYKGNQIGMRSGSIIILDNINFQKDLQFVLGPTWQVSS
jgi:hypothetical protein